MRIPTFTRYADVLTAWKPVIFTQLSGKISKNENIWGDGSLGKELLCKCEDLSPHRLVESVCNPSHPLGETGDPWELVG